jgi:predicted Rossmann fold flavoprotein
LRNTPLSIILDEEMLREDRRMKVLIIGGGAAGMLAALTAAEDPQNEVTLLERQARVGRKLLATGNGRCNLTNRNLSPACYHGTDPDFVRPALAAFGAEDALRYFGTLGLLTVTEPSGRVYPLSDQANSVVDVLRFAMESRGVAVVGSADVLEIAKKARGWRVTATTGEWYGEKVIVAAGGCAGKKLGGTHSGYRLLGQLGHRCTSLAPSLTQLKTEPTWVRALKGVRADGRMVLKAGGRTLGASEGELQFTDFGVSGPAAFELSRAASVTEGEKTLLIDFLREYTRDDARALLAARRAAFPNLPAEELLSGTLQSRLGKTILRRCGVAPEKAAPRPVVVGLRALRHLRGAGAGADGPAPHRAGQSAARKCASAPAGHLGPVAPGRARPRLNVQFGEGGAGTFSDGKLYSQISDKQHHGRKVLTEFVAAGAPEEILYVSKPHIGTFRLVSMVERMRATIESLGGEIRFGQRVDDLLVEVDAAGVRHLRGVTLASGEELRADHVVLALGHSARDTFAMLHARGVFVEAKPFSLGFRIEHPQSLIDQARFGPQAGHALLGAADYKLVHHASNGRSVYSFCMCPGGTVSRTAASWRRRPAG